MAVPCHHSSSYLCCHHYTAHLSHDRAARSNCDAEFRTDCSFHAELRGAWQPIAGPCHCVHRPPHPPSMGAAPLGHCKQRPWSPVMVQQVSTTPGGGGTSPIWLRPITCKAPALFTENPFRKSWEIGNKFAVGWRGEVRLLRSVCMLAGSLCTLARFIVYSYKLYNMIY